MFPFQGFLDLFINKTVETVGGETKWKLEPLSLGSTSAIWLRLSMGNSVLLYVWALRIGLCFPGVVITQRFRVSDEQTFSLTSSLLP